MLPNRNWNLVETVCYAIIISLPFIVIPFRSFEKIAKLFFMQRLLSRSNLNTFLLFRDGRSVFHNSCTKVFSSEDGRETDKNSLEEDRDGVDKGR